MIWNFLLKFFLAHKFRARTEDALTRFTYTPSIFKLIPLVLAIGTEKMTSKETNKAFDSKQRQTNFPKRSQIRIDEGPFKTLASLDQSLTSLDPIIDLITRITEKSVENPFFVQTLFLNSSTCANIHAYINTSEISTNTNRSETHTT